MIKILKTLLNVDGDVKARDYCHINEKYRGCAHSDSNINVKLNHKIPAHS